MRMYTVSDASQMLNVNEETIRRWIRDGKLVAKRAVGRGGNTILLEDIIAFANIPPRAYLLALESWLNANNIKYKKIEDTQSNNTSDRKIALATGATAGATSIIGAAASATSTAGITGLAASAVGAAGLTTALAGPVGIGVAALTYATTKSMKRKKYHTYSIQLLDIPDDSDSNNLEELPQDDINDTEVKESNQKTVNTNIEADHTNNNTFDNNNIKHDTDAIDVFKEIEHAKRLLDADIITDEEFKSIKSKLIAKL